jgi:N-acylneuraminate cytidylyltransferase
MKPLIVIPARGGSKGVPRKNIKLLNGKPLIEYTINAARGVFVDELICVSTDDEEIKSVAEDLGLSVPFLRPKNLASDTSSTYEVLLHAIDFYHQLGYVADTLVLLQPTSPFRTSRHIAEAMKLYDDKCEMVVSVYETASNPYYVLKEVNARGWLVGMKKGNFTRRQDCPAVYQINGAIYIINVKALRKMPLVEFRKVRKYEMDRLSSHDIDDPLDWLVAETIIQSQNSY